MSSELEEIFGDYDFVNDQDRGAQLLPDFLKNSDNVKNIINAIMPEIQELHDAQKDVFSIINIFEATGSQLDNIFGQILDLERNVGQSDDSYREDLLAQTSKFARSGEISVMKSIFMNLIGASTVSLFEYQAASFKMTAVAASIPTDSELASIRATLVDAKQGGNGMTLAVTDSETPFLLGDFDSQQLNDPNGLSGGGFTGGTLLQGF